MQEHITAFSNFFNIICICCRILYKLWQPLSIWCSWQQQTWCLFSHDVTSSSTSRQHQQ